MSASTEPTIVLVHGAWADASGFNGVIRELTAAGYRVLAPPNPLRTLSGDASAVATFVAAIEEPVLLIGHSYGGAVIGQASAGLTNVVGLVYLAAFSLEVGESCASVTAPYPPSKIAAAAEPTPYTAPGAPDGPDLVIGEGGFRDAFCADVPVDLASVMYATQRPLAVSAFTENATAAGWKSLPSWYLVASHDNAIPPQAQRFMAERMGSTTEEIAGSHTAFVSQPVRTTEFILSALGNR